MKTDKDLRGGCDGIATYGGKAFSYEKGFPAAVGEFSISLWRRFSSFRRAFSSFSFRFCSILIQSSFVLGGAIMKNKAPEIIEVRYNIAKI